MSLSADGKVVAIGAPYNDGNGSNSGHVRVHGLELQPQCITLSALKGSGTTEASGTDTYTVVLDAKPASNVVINLTSDDTGEVTVSSASLTFTSNNGILLRR